MATTATKMPSTIRKPLDIWLCAGVLLLVVIGLWMVFDTSYAKALDDPAARGDAWFFVRRQGVQGALGGMVALLFCWRIGYWRLRPLAVGLMFVGLALLIAVFAPKVGSNVNNAWRWIKLGPVSFQPSEFAKLFLVLYLARILSRLKEREFGSFSEALLPPLVVALAYIGLVEREPDLGTAVIMFLTTLTMLHLAGAKKLHLLGVIVVLAGFAVIALFGFTHRGNRIRSFLNPELDPKGIGYQVKHSRAAVGSGGWIGMGLGQGREKYYLPQRDTDFIYATIAEETGFAGSIAVMALLAFVGLRGLRIARQTQDPFGRLVAVGVSSMILWQTLINIGVATASIPATGVPLPFISYGSSSLFMLMASVGILLSVAQYPLPPMRRNAELR